MLQAASVPSTTAKLKASTTAPNAITTVLDKARITSPNTGWWVCSEMPRSPETARRSQFRYCSGIGLSKPYARLINSMSALLASAGIIDWIGSPGAR